ncbi:MAG: septum formation initiator family protein [Oscillospiraceae bacterium]|nr:septum formation initiator family protein [Oscillospiraceae bacterium]
MAKSAKKSKKKNSFITVLVLGVLIAVLGIELMQLYGKLRREQVRQEELSSQVQELRQENDSLRSDLDKADDEEFIKNKAREQLNMVEAGERIFIDVNH